MMLPKIIFCTAVSVATVAVILLALISPSVHRKPQKKPTRPWLALSLYIQHPHIPTPSNHDDPHLTVTDGAFVFHHRLTAGPKNTSRGIGKAQGFIIPIEHFAHSAFNIIYLTLDTDDYSGGLGVHAKNMGRHKTREELMVVGGTGSFAFARGTAVFRRTDDLPPHVDAMYHVKLRLRFPDRVQKIPV